MGAGWLEMDCVRMKEDQRVKDREEMELNGRHPADPDCEESDILEEILIEDLAVDGICGVY